MCHDWWCQACDSDHAAMIGDPKRKQRKGSGNRLGFSVLRPCTAPRELKAAQGRLTPARLKAAAAHLRG